MGKGRKRHRFGSLHVHCLSLHAALTLEVCSPKSGDTKKVHYKLSEARGVESFKQRFEESGNQEFILAAQKPLKVILQHKSNVLELRKFPLARISHDLRMV